MTLSGPGPNPRFAKPAITVRKLFLFKGAPKILYSADTCLPSSKISEGKVKERERISTRNGWRCQGSEAAKILRTSLAFLMIPTAESH
jgi:hypothetical protein